MTDLNSLARTLAERLCEEGWLNTGADSACDVTEIKHGEKVATDAVEAVIREAIEKTLELAMEAVDSNSVRTRCPRCELSLVDEECQMCGWKTPRAAIRSLKQSNSGMEVRK